MKKLIQLNLSSLNKTQIKKVFKVLLNNGHSIDIETAKELQSGIFDKEIYYLQFNENYQEWLVDNINVNKLSIDYNNFLLLFENKS